MTLTPFFNFASAMDRHIEIRRLVAEHHARVEKYKIENAEALAKCQPRSVSSYLDWDYEPSGIQGEINGELGS
jgi:hypothetical protein